jgi:hypothetical protein
MKENIKKALEIVEKIIMIISAIVTILDFFKS